MALKVIFGSKDRCELLRAKHCLDGWQLFSVVADTDPIAHLTAYRQRAGEPR